MGVRIDEINVKGLGPIDSAQLPLGPFNLIYGHNEKGKTYLVEFVTRALFKNQKIWSLRSGGGRGQVAVSGLKGQPQPLKMTRTSKPKLEEILEEEEAGLPTKISRLLVVKGAELSFDDKTRNGIDEVVLKDLLSGEGVLDGIQKKITRTVQNTKFTDGKIDGKSQGLISQRDSRLDLLRIVDGLFEEIEALYSGSERQKLANQAALLEEQIAEQKAAKRHEAFLASQGITTLVNQIEKLPREKLQELDSISSELEFAERRISSFEEELADFETKSKHYEWLSQAVDWYERRGVESGAKPNRGLLIGAGISAILAILFIVLQVPIAAIAFVLIAAGSGLFYWRQMERSMELAVDADEMKKLSAEFEKRFDQPLTGLPQMRELKESMDEAYIGAERRRKDLEKEFSERDALVERLGSLFRQLTGEMPEKELWPDAIREVNARHSSLQEQLVALKEKRARLDIAEDDYREKPTAVEYDQTALQDLIRELEVTEDRLEDEESKLGNLKQNIRAQTRDEYSADWELVIQNLQERRKGVANEYREITAEIIAGMLVNDVLEDNRAQEKEKIGERLSSPEVKNAISSITGRYKDVRYEEEQVLIEDEFGSFKLSELSTGAREQVLLGLRMGFAEQIFKQRELFLLLDDAFQHADWSRRKRLVDQSVALAKKGWQIIYFTMDDHIRDLFDEAGHKHFPDSYRHHDLNVPNTAITPGE